MSAAPVKQRQHQHKKHVLTHTGARIRAGASKDSPYGMRLSSGLSDERRAGLRTFGGCAGVVLEKGEVILAATSAHAGEQAGGFAGMGCAVGASPPALRGWDVAPEGEVAERRLGGFLAPSSPQAG